MVQRYYEKEPALAMGRFKSSRGRCVGLTLRGWWGS